MRPTAPHLEARSLSFRYPEYPGFHPCDVFQNASFSVASEGIELLLGAPDTGKTTLARIIAGLVPRFTGGTVSGTLCLRQDPLTAPPYARLPEVGLVFQSPNEQLITGRCDTEVAFALESLGLPRETMRRRVREALEEEGLASMEERSPHSLSGGEKKRLLLACLWAVDPPLWILDETLEELDARSRQRLLQRLSARRRTVLILSAKWHRSLAEVCTAVHFLQNGRVRSLRPAPPVEELEAALRREGLVLPGRAQRHSSAGPPLLRAEGLRFAYPDSSFLLEVPNLELHRGEVLALVGDNGSGKSTLARLLCGLAQPQTGNVLLAERDAPLEQASPQRLNRAVAYLFQNPDLQIFLPTVAEELAYGPRLAGWPEGTIRSRVAESARIFGLPSLDTPPSLMSYGARKRLQAATYHILGRRVVIFDEGDSGLGQVEFVRVVEQFRSPERSLVVITHDGELASYLADRTVRLAGGRLL